MNEASYQKLRETAWRRKLTPAESEALRAWLAAHPQARADWEADLELNRVLGSLPDLPVPTNFTARVLQAVERETRSAGRAPATRTWWWRSFLPRMAVVAVLLGGGLFSLAVRQRQLAQKARSVAVVSEVASLPDPDVLRDFEAIRLLDTKSRPDMELLALMK